MHRWTLAVISLLAVAYSLEGNIRGTVIDEQGRPVAGAAVAAHRIETAEAVVQRLRSDTPRRAEIASTKSKPDGSFDLSLEAGGVVDLAVQSAGFAPVAVRATDGEDVGALLLRPAALVRGRVTSSAGPVENAVVEWSSGAATWTATTNPKGEFEVPDPSRWNARAIIHHPDYALQHVTTRRQGRGLAISLDRGIPLRVRVIDDEERAVQGATVRIDGVPYGGTDEEGFMTVARAPRSWRLLTASTGSLVASMTSASKLEVLRLQRGVVVSGRVVDRKDRRAITGATVELRSGGFGGSQPLAATITDANGRYAFEAVRAGTWQLSVSHPRHITEVLNLTLAPDSAARREIALTAAGRIAGSVRSEGGGAVAGARITAMQTGRFGADDTSYSAPDGRFVLRSVLPETQLNVEATRRGSAAGVTPAIEVRPGEERKGLVITIPLGFEISARVVDEKERPVAGASVLSQPSGSESPVGLLVAATSDDAVRTDREGWFRLRVNAGNHQLFIRADGYATESLGVSVERDVQLPPITLPAGQSISGRVVRPDGKGVAEVSVIAMQPLQTPVITGDDGSFSLSGLKKGTVAVFVRKRSESVTITRSVEAPTTDLVIELSEGARVRGRVVDDTTGSPIRTFEAGAVSLQGRRTEVPMMMPFESPTGEFSFENLPPGQGEITIKAPGYARMQIEGLKLEDGKEISDLEARLEKGTRLRGKVVDSNGAPIEGASVVTMWVRQVGGISSSRGLDQSEKTDLNGEFVLEDLERGERLITADAADFITEQKQVLVEGREMQVEFRLQPGLTVAGSVVDESGRPVEGATVTAHTPARRFVSRPASTDAAGRFRVTGVAPGATDLMARKAGRPPAELKSVELTSSRSDIRLVMASGGTIEGRVVGLDPQSPPRVRIYVFGASGFHDEVEAGRDGSFRISGIPEGTAEVSGYAGFGMESRATSSRNVTVRNGAVTQVELEVRDGFTVRGRVVEKGKPAVDARVSVTSRDPLVESWGSAAVARDGSYSIGGLSAALHLVTVSGRVGGVPIYARTHDISGDMTIDIEIPTSRISGRIVDAGSGRGVAGATIIAQPLSATELPASWNSIVSKSDPTGGFDVSPVGDASYRLRVEAENYGTELFETSGGSSGLTIRLTPVPAMGIRIVDAQTGEELEGVALILDTQQRTVVMKEIGVTRGDRQPVHLPPGDYSGTFFAPRHAARTVRFTAPREELTVALSRGGSLVLESAPETPRVVRLIAADGTPFRRWASGPPEISFRGALTIDAIAAGTYTLQLLGKGNVIEKSQPVVIEAGRETRVPL